VSGTVLGTRNTAVNKPHEFLTSPPELPFQGVRHREPGIVVHVYNPSYSEGRGRSVVVRPVPGKKCKTLSKKVTKQKRGVGMVQVV
jgi:hypothetical protein